MLKRSCSEPQWFLPEDRRRLLRATIKHNGCLCLGKVLRAQLPERVQVGFLSSECTLLIKPGGNGAFVLNRNGLLHMPTLSQHIGERGLELPLGFIFAWEERGQCWQGRVDPFFKRGKSMAARRTRREMLDEKQVLCAYGWVVEKLINSVAKTTPPEERRAIASEELLWAVREYCEGYGSFADYLTERVKQRLILENKQYTQASNQVRLSLDAPLGRDGGANYYAMLADTTTDSIAVLEDGLAEQAFIAERLSPLESSAYTLLLDGCGSTEIARQLRITHARLEEICLKIGEKRRCYFEDSA